MATDPWPPYTVYWDNEFLRDCRHYQGDEDILSVLYEGVSYVVERDPYACSRSIGPETDLRLMRTAEYFGDTEPMYVLLEVEKEPPDGVVALRRVRSVADVRAGLDFVTEDPED